MVEDSSSFCSICIVFMDGRLVSWCWAQPVTNRWGSWCDETKPSLLKWCTDISEAHLTYEKRRSRAMPTWRYDLYEPGKTRQANELVLMLRCENAEYFLFIAGRPIRYSAVSLSDQKARLLSSGTICPCSRSSYTLVFSYRLQCTKKPFSFKTTIFLFLLLVCHRTIEKSLHPNLFLVHILLFIFIEWILHYWISTNTF